MRKIAGCPCAGNAGNVFPRRRLEWKPQFSDPGVMYVRIAYTRWRGNFSRRISTRNFSYLARGPLYVTLCTELLTPYFRQFWIKMICLSEYSRLSKRRIDSDLLTSAVFSSVVCFRPSLFSFHKIIYNNGRSYTWLKESLLNITSCTSNKVCLLW